MKYRIEVQSEPRFSDQHAALVLAAENTLGHERAEEGSLSIVLADSETLQELNRTFAGENHPTDVLSFSDGSLDPESGKIYFGDVIIAMDIASSQAESAGHSLSAELALLAIHGVLHLLGHDHADDEGRLVMWAAQGSILKQLGHSMAANRMGV